MWQASPMKILEALRRLACICAGALVLAACGTTGKASGPSGKNCDPTGSPEARQACNR